MSNAGSMNWDVLMAPQVVDHCSTAGDPVLSYHRRTPLLMLAGTGAGTVRYGRRCPLAHPYLS
jgi:hypothetical protein